MNLERTEMNFLKSERAVFDRYFPGLRERLEEMSFEEKEKPDSRIVEIYRDAGGPALLVDQEHGGKGASPADALAVHLVLGSLSPSLAIAATMHDFTVAFLAEYAMYGDATVRFLKEIAERNLYLASGFAEGKSGANILEPTMTAHPCEGGFRVSGTKKPCSLSSSMDYLTASVLVEGREGMPAQRAIAIIPASSTGIERFPFWTANSLGAAQSDEVRLTDVVVPDDFMFLPETGVPLDVVEAGGFLWFEFLVTASYLGVSCGLAQKVLSNKRGISEERVRLIAPIEMAISALRAVAYEMQNPSADPAEGEGLVARMLMIRYATQQVIGTTNYFSSELLGGIHFIRDRSVEYALGCGTALAYHPPSRLSIAEAVDVYLMGGNLQMA